MSTMSSTTPGAELSVREAAQRVGRAEETVRRWIWSKRLPARKVGNSYRVLVRDLDALASTTGVPEQRSRRPSLDRPSLAEWLDEVARWRETTGLPPRASAADLVIEDRAERSEHARY